MPDFMGILAPNPARHSRKFSLTLDGLRLERAVRCALVSRTAKADIARAVQMALYCHVFHFFVGLNR